MCVAAVVRHDTKVLSLATRLTPVDVAAIGDGLHIAARSPRRHQHLWRHVRQRAHARHHCHDRCVVIRCVVMVARQPEIADLGLAT